MATALRGRVQWDEDESWQFHSVAEAERLVDDLERRARGRGARLAAQRRLVVVEVEGNGALCIGLGADETVVTHIAEDGMPPYHTSLGDPSRTKRIWFEFMGEGSEFGESELVPAAQARGAIRHWLKTGELSVVNWHEV
jgi:hypothetical protein